MDFMIFVKVGETDKEVCRNEAQTFTVCNRTIKSAYKDINDKCSGEIKEAKNCGSSSNCQKKNSVLTSCKNKILKKAIKQNHLEDKIQIPNS